jgi:hypothetical protein
VPACCATVIRATAASAGLLGATVEVGDGVGLGAGLGLADGAGVMLGV